MRIELRLFGPLRDREFEGRLSLPADNVSTIRDVRRLLASHAEQHWGGSFVGLLAVSAIADDQTILRDDEPVPRRTCLAVLPPVNGG
ncbi:MAG: MoaD/ThiS family protein [Xanthomonadales bacterium]|nr:MoaD/ThiS family protein [Xanthomonadales bacterium]